MKIEWASSFRSDGSRRRPPPSTMHGWLAKMRGTLLGNEELRSKGMREMKEAQTARRRRAERRASTGRSIFSIFSFYMGPSKKPASVRKVTKPREDLSRPTYRTRQSHQSNRSARSSTRPSGPSRRSTGGTNREPSSQTYSGSRNYRRSTR